MIIFTTQLLKSKSTPSSPAAFVGLVSVQSSSGGSMPPSTPMTPASTSDLPPPPGSPAAVTVAAPGVPTTAIPACPPGVDEEFRSHHAGVFSDVPTSQLQSVQYFRKQLSNGKFIPFSMCPLLFPFFHRTKSSYSESA
jgi:hypothetical protein